MVAEAPKINSDEAGLALCLELARLGRDIGEIPIGAIVCRQGEVIATAHNETVVGCDPSAHAEIVALRRASQALGNHRLGDCVVYASLEPCVMCAGALIQARIAALVYGADDPRFGAFSRSQSIFDAFEHNHTFEVRSGTLAAEAGILLKEFFRQRR